MFCPRKTNITQDIRLANSEWNRTKVLSHMPPECERKRETANSGIKLMIEFSNI